MRLEVSQPILDFADMAKLRDIEQQHARQVPQLHAGHHLPAGLGPRRRRSQAGVAVRRGGGRDQGRPEHPDHQRPRRGPDAGRHPRRCWRCRRSTSTWCARACAPPPAWWSKPARRARCITSACWPATARKPCIPTWRWKPWSSMHKDLPGDLNADKAIYNYVKAIGKGLSKIMSKMGVSHVHELLRRPAVRSHRPEQRHGRQVLHRHRQPRRRHRRVRDRAGSDPHAQGRLRRRPGARQHARRRRRIRLAHPRRRAHVDAGRDRQAAARDARQQLEHLQGIRAADQRPEPAPHDAARPVRVQDRSDQGDLRSTKSSRPRKSSSASPPAPCRSARSRPRRTPRWPSP